MARVVELPPKVPQYPPRRLFDVYLAPHEGTWTGDQVLALKELPVQGEIHTGTSPLCTVSRRGAVRIGPCRYAVYIHYRSLEPDIQERPHVIRGPEQTPEESDQ